MPRRGRNRLLCNEFQCMRQFASGMLSGHLGPHNPRLTIEQPLRSRFRRLCTPLPTAGDRGCSIRPLFHLRVKAAGPPRVVRVSDGIPPCGKQCRMDPS